MAMLRQQPSDFLNKLIPKSQGYLIWGLIIMFIIGVTVLLFALYIVSNEVVKSIAVHNAITYARTINYVRDYYTNQVVSRVQDEGIQITHDYHQKKGAIPLPVTLSIELGELVTTNEDGVKVRLYSDYPFDFRTNGGPHDMFEREALTYLRQHPEGEFIQFETINGQLSLRYAVSNIMQPSCVACHNNHPNSTKIDWRTGDVRGVLEIVHPIKSTVGKVENSIQLVFFIATTLSLLGLVGLGVVIHRLRQNATTLDQYATDLETEIIQRKQAEAEKLRLTAIEQELKVARDLQKSLLPPAHPNWPNLDVECYSQPARQVGGDFYAYYAFSETEPTRYAIVVGDVTGKGTPAALLMSISLASFRSTIRQSFAPSCLLSHLDQTLVDYVSPNHQNCALVYAEFQQISNPTSDYSWTVKAANAGCIAPIIRHNDGTVEWLDVGGLPLGSGVSTELQYQTVTVDLVQQDMMIFVSDGIIEANNIAGEMFGFKRFEQAVAQGPNNTAQAMLYHLKTAVDGFVDNNTPHDDLTIVVVSI